MKYTVRPISDRTWLNQGGKKPSRFDASWSSTLQLLDREITALQGRDVVFEIDVDERHIRMDGQLYANARPTSHAVAIAFESKHGPLFYRCDRFYTQWSDQGPDWQHNVRAIALTLEALRAVDRYGASASGEQYRGYKAIGAGPAHAMGASTHMTTEQAYDVLCAVLDLASVADLDIEDAKLVRRARAAAHPDRHGDDQTLWDQVEQAARVLRVV